MYSWHLNTNKNLISATTLCISLDCIYIAKMIHGPSNVNVIIDITLVVQKCLKCQNSKIFIKICKYKNENCAILNKRHALCLIKFISCWMYWLPVRWIFNLCSQHGNDMKLSWVQINFWKTEKRSETSCLSFSPTMSETELSCLNVLSLHPLVLQIRVLLTWCWVWSTESKSSV